jgi:hypothetical protein
MLLLVRYFVSAEAFMALNEEMNDEFLDELEEAFVI